MNQKALGLIEMVGFAGLTEAADAAVKAASVELAGVEKIEGGIISIHLRGDVGAVRAAVDAGAQAAQKVGTLVAFHVIPNPHSDMVRIFHLEGPAGNAPPPAAGEQDLESLSVSQLRRLARETSGISIQGRQISRANREQLIREIQRARGEHPPD